MGRYKILNQQAMHFVTLTTVGWIDVFSRVTYRDIIVDSLRFCQANKGLNVHAYVVMSNHLHLILSAQPEFELSKLIRDFKSYTGRHIIQTIIENKKESRLDWMKLVLEYHARQNLRDHQYQFWQEYNCPRECFSPAFTAEKLNYIHYNPVKNRLVENPEHYVYSSARNYAGKAGILDVELIEFPVKGSGFVRRIE